jgi:3'(2'), 5'-bisphosphate nucleotidase
MSYTYNWDMVAKACIDAGLAIVEIYNHDFSVTAKEDASPLTNADIVSHEILESALYQSYPVLSEESENTTYMDRKDLAYFLAHRSFRWN